MAEEKLNEKISLEFLNEDLNIFYELLDELETITKGKFLTICNNSKSL